MKIHLLSLTHTQTHTRVYVYVLWRYQEEFVKRRFTEYYIVWRDYSNEKVYVYYGA